MSPQYPPDGEKPRKRRRKKQSTKRRRGVRRTKRREKTGPWQTTSLL